MTETRAKEKSIDIVWDIPDSPHREYLNAKEEEEDKLYRRGPTINYQFTK
jgi:hypothetical protein